MLDIATGYWLEVVVSADQYMSGKLKSPPTQNSHLMYSCLSCQLIYDSFSMFRTDFVWRSIESCYYDGLGSVDPNFDTDKFELVVYTYCSANQVIFHCNENSSYKKSIPYNF